MIATNLCVWLNVLVQETKHEILNFYNPNITAAGKNSYIYIGRGERAQQHNKTVSDMYQISKKKNMPPDHKGYILKWCMIPFAPLEVNFEKLHLYPLQKRCLKSDSLLLFCVNMCL